MLNIGLDLGVISPTLFTMMVLMALATTLATTPVLQHLLSQILPERGRDAVKTRIPALARSEVRLTADPTV